MKTGSQWQLLPEGSWEVLSGGHNAGWTSLMSFPLMLTSPWYATASAYPQTSSNTIALQTSGHISNTNTLSSVLSMSTIANSGTEKTRPCLKILWTSLVQRYIFKKQSSSEFWIVKKASVFPMIFWSFWS